MAAIIPPTLSDRMRSAIRALIRAEDPNRTYRAFYEYAVQSTSDDSNGNSATIDASLTDTTQSLPAITKIQVRISIAGGMGKPAPGARLLVGFINGDPTRPFVLGALDTIPLNATIDASQSVKIGPSAQIVSINGGGPAVARLGDQVQAFLPPAVPVAGLLNGSTPFTGTMTIVNPISGAITQGSPTVNTK